MPRTTRGFHRMQKTFTTFSAVLVMMALVTLSAQQSTTAQQSATPDPSPKNPLRFNAIAQSTGNQSLNTQGRVEISIERWSTEAEREELVKELGAASFKRDGQQKLLKTLERVKPRTGFIKLPNTLGWDLRYAHENMLPDGTRQIIIATDKPVSGSAAFNASESLDYPFTFADLRFPKGSDKGTGKLLTGAAVMIKDNKLQLENYAIQPVNLTEITEHDAKK